MRDVMALSWRQLHLAPPVEPEQARAVLVALASLPGQPRVVLETHGTGGRVSWRVGGAARVMPDVVAALVAHLPDLRVTREVHDEGVADMVTTAAAVRMPRSDRLPLRHEATEPVTRGMLAALAATRSGELLRVQLILGPRIAPKRISDIDPVVRRAVTVKLSEHGFGCALRIAARADTPARAHHLVSGVAAALKGLEVPRVHVHLRRASPISIVTAASPWFWPLWLHVSDLVPLLGWPTAEPPLPGMPALHPRLLPPHAETPRRGRTLGVSGTDTGRMVALTTEDSLRHLHVLGPSGVGKSTLMAQLALQDITVGHGVVVIDPKGDLVDDIAARVPADRLDDLVILDARDPAPVGLNGLVGAGDPDLAADVLLSVFRSLYEESWGPRTHDILHACLLTLARRGDASLVMVPLLLTNPGFRRSTIGRVVQNDPMGLGSFWAWFDGISDAERTQAIAPLMNKLRPILMRPGLRAVFGQRTPRFDVGQIFTERKVLLVSLAKGAIGPEAALLLGSVAVALVWQAALARVAIPAERRRPVFVHIDEVQDYLRLPGDLSDALAQARGLGVGFTLAHQHLGQLPPALRTAVFANARSRVAFALSPEDARSVATTTSGVLEPEDFRALPVYQAYAHLLTGGGTLAPVSIATRPLGPTLRSPNDARAHARARYGQPLDQIERDLLDLAGMPSTTTPHDGRGAGDGLGRSRRRPPTERRTRRHDDATARPGDRP